MFEGYGNYIRELDPDRTLTAEEKERIADMEEQKRHYIASRAVELMGSVKAAEAIQDDMTGYFGHEPEAIAMLLSQAASTGDYSLLMARIQRVAQDVAAREWGR